jgi:hypothetical protein
VKVGNIVYIDIKREQEGRTGQIEIFLFVRTST